MEVYLSLPVGEALVGHREAVVVVTALERRFKHGCLLVAPTRVGVVIERHGRGDALPQIEVAVGIEATLLDVAHVGFGSQDEAPGDVTVGGVVDQDEPLARHCLDAELGVGVLCVAGEVGEQGVGAKLYVGLLADVALSVLPVIDLEAPGAGLVAQCHVDVGGSAATPLRAVVDVGHAVVAGAVGVGAALAVVGGEGDTVVIHTEGFLLIGLC